MPPILHLNRNLSELDHGESSPKNLLVYIYIYIYINNLDYMRPRVGV